MRNCTRSLKLACIFSLMLFSISVDVSRALAAEFEIVSWFEPPGPCPHGLAWDGTHLWLSDTCDKKVYELSTVGEVISSFPYIERGPNGLAWDGEFLRGTLQGFPGSSGEVISKLTTQGELVSYFQAPGPCLPV